MLKIVEISLLYDYYGQLLTEKQQKVFELYYNEDLSLGEIAENLSITRQAVYDNIKRVEKLLNYYEEKLGLIEKLLYRKDKIQQTKLKLSEYKNREEYIENAKLKELIKIMENTLEELLIE